MPDGSGDRDFRRPTTNVLIIEADAAIAAALSEALRARGFAPDLASHGREARALCGLRRYDVAICDRCIEPGDADEGLAFIAWLRASSPWTRSLLLTSRRPGLGESEALEKADLVLRRPQPLSVIADALVSLSGGRPRI